MEEILRSLLKFLINSHMKTNPNYRNLKNHKVERKRIFQSPDFFDHVIQIWRENASILPRVVPKIMAASKTRLTGRQ